MSFIKAPAIVALLLVVLQACVCDVLVQLNVNRPFNDVNEKFISFAVKPEDLYKALDGSNRKSLTRMANMLGDSYVKFVGDYYFAADSDKKLRNPTKIMWKGFNRWSRAVNWTMIIPVPYSPDAWDPMLALKILNSSYSSGISDCIWQLGTDFVATYAKDYVAELNTLNLIVDTFRPYVDDWQIIGADISAGSSAEEARRYVEMSKNLNAAFGWTHPAELTASNSLSSYIYSNDPALKMLLSKKVPVWLTLPTKSKQLTANTDDVTEALSWAQSLGDAANAGFDTIFKRLSLSELEAPNHSFYVTALFKKVMGSRVFPARPLGLFANSNKLYTHCANSVSGGIAFMVVNMGETPVQISLTSITHLTANEVWQYTLSFKNGKALLNNGKMSLNSTMRPLKIAKNPLKHIQLNTPGKSVGFWVLPTANLEHCQYTEIEAKEIEKDTNSVEEAKDKKYTSSDKLLKKLIKETALSHSVLSHAINRRRRYATFSNRPKRFLLKDSRDKGTKGWGGFFDSFKFKEKPPNKREAARKERQTTALDWIKSFMEGAWHNDAPLLKRATRSTDNYFSSFFAAKEDKPTTLTKKIFDIKQPEKKIKPLFNLGEFDEEAFFKKMSDRTEPEYMRPPEGDVLLKHIATLDGEEIEENKELHKKTAKKAKSILNLSKESFGERKPLRLLPAEFYEALPGNVFKAGPNKMSLSSTLNSLLFPEPFSKKDIAKLKPLKESEPQLDSVAEVEEVGNAKFHESGQLAHDFLRAQKELRKAFLKDNEETANEETANDNKTEIPENDFEVEEEEPVQENKREFEKRKLIDFLAQNLESYFDERAQLEGEKREVTDAPQKISAEIPWWDLSAKHKKRPRRALRLQLPDEAWQENMINKDDELTPLGATMPEQLAVYEYVVENEPKKKDVKSKESMPHAIAATVKRKVSNFVDIVARHVSEWYNTLTTHIEIETTTARSNKN